MSTNPIIDPVWLDEFRQRIKEFSPDSGSDVIPVSIKLRIDSGCFCRNCAPSAHRIIEDYRHDSKTRDDATKIIEHESGPEILTYLQPVATALALTTAVINLVVAIAKARSDGVKKGDKAGDPFELIIRRFDRDGGFSEEKILKIPANRDVNCEKLAQALMDYSVKRPSGKAKKKGRKKPKTAAPAKIPKKGR